MNKALGTFLAVSAAIAAAVVVTSESTAAPVAVTVNSAPQTTDGRLRVYRRETAARCAQVDDALGSCCVRLRMTERLTFDDIAQRDGLKLNAEPGLTDLWMPCGALVLALRNSACEGQSSRGTSWGSPEWGTLTNGACAPATPSDGGP